VSQKTTAICVVDEQGRRLWRGVCVTDPGAISARVLKHAGVDVKVGVETGSMTPWLVHGLRSAGLHVECLDARRVKAALQMRLNKTGENDAEGLAQVMRTGWYRPVHVKSLDAHRARALLGARAQLVGMTTRLSNMIRGVLKTFGLLPGAGRGLRFDRRVEALLEGAPEIGLIVRPLLATWRQLREQIAVFDKAVQRQVKADPICRLLMTVPGIGALSSLVYVSTVEDPSRFTELCAEVGDGLTGRRRRIVGVFEPPLLQQRSDTPCPMLTSSSCFNQGRSPIRSPRCCATGRARYWLRRSRQRWRSFSPSISISRPRPA
jgi:transposase